MEGREIEGARIPEDAGAHKVSVLYVFNPETKEFIPANEGLFSLEPQLHRESIAAQDTEYPSVENGINCKGFSRCRFDVIVEGQNISSLKVSILRWNTKVNQWFHSGVDLQMTDGSGFSPSGGKVSLVEDEALGAVIFLWVSEFIGDYFNMDIYYVLC